MDIKAKIEELVKKITEDKALLSKFKTDPEKVIEALLGIDIPDDAAQKVVSGVKSAISLDKLDDNFGDILGKAKDLLGK